MPFKTVSQLSWLLLAAALSLLLSLTVIYRSGKTPPPSSLRYSAQDVRMLSAREINHRTLTLAAAIDDAAR